MEVGRLNGMLAWKLITSNDLWREILEFVGKDCEGGGLSDEEDNTISAMKEVVLKFKEVFHF